MPDNTALLNANIDGKLSKAEIDAVRKHLSDTIDESSALYDQMTTVGVRAMVVNYSIFNKGKHKAAQNELSYDEDGNLKDTGALLKGYLARLHGLNMAGYSSEIDKIVNTPIEEDEVIKTVKDSLSKKPVQLPQAADSVEKKR